MTGAGKGRACADRGRSKANVLDAVAAYALKDLPPAEAGVRAARQFDPKHSPPRAQDVLGMVRKAKQEYADAASVRTHIGKIGEATPLDAISDLNVLSVREVTIPGGMAALTITGQFHAASEYRDFFGKFCRRRAPGDGARHGCRRHRNGRCAGVPVYTVAQGTAFQIPHMLKEQAEISEATGALLFKIQRPNEIRQVFERIAEDLQHGYLLAFRPSGGADREWRRIEVQLRTQKGYKIRGRQGYYLE